MKFEHRTQPLVSRSRFAVRLLKQAAIAGGVIGVSLGLGAVGYHVTEGLDWIDSLLNAAMILTGMGPASTLHTQSGKLFATAYALFSGIVFLSAAALLLAPVFHRLIHHFHLEGEMEEERASPPSDPAQGGIRDRAPGSERSATRNSSTVP